MTMPFARLGPIRSWSSLILVSLFVLVLSSLACSAEWQWSGVVKGGIEPAGPARAFLWIPAGCQRLRGVVLAQHNMEEISLETMGEYESAHNWSTEGLRERQQHPRMPLSMLACPAEGHFASSDKKAAFLALYIRKAVQEGQVVPQNNTHQQVNLKFLPQADGVTFKLTATFLETVPGGSPRPATWTGLPAGSPVGHATGGGPISIDRICGPFAKLGPDTFMLRFDETGMGSELTPLPPRAKFPVRVTVVAWQYGRSSEPFLQTAEPVERTFAIVK